LRRSPLSLYLVSLLGLILAVLLIWEGLYIRLFSSFKNPEALWVEVITKVGMDPLGFAWPWIVLGISWISALCGVWLKLPWGRWALWFVCIISLLYVEVGAILATIILIGLSMPVTRSWMREIND
jgi:hypothetical protein